MEEWVPLLGYPGYSVSNMGQVRNDRRESVLTVRKTMAKSPYVGLMLDGIQVNRSLPKLVADTFLPSTRPSFNVPIHFDGDMMNCQVSNLDWRPRWFAQKHTRQFRMPLPTAVGAIRETRSKEIFEDCWHAVFMFGLLYMELLSAIPNKTYVFPTMQTYEWA